MESSKDPELPTEGEGDTTEDPPIYDYANLDEEIDYVTSRVVRSEAFSDNSVRFAINHTILKTWELVIKFTENYPSSALNCQIKSRTLPPKLLDIMKKGADKKLEELAEQSKYQLLKIYEYYNEILENNNLIPAWKEIQRVKKLIDPKLDEIKLFMKAGKIKFTLTKDKLKLVLLLEIPAEYPLNPLKLAVLKGKGNTEMDENLLKVFEDHMCELIRRFHKGYDGLEVDINEGKIGENAKVEESPLMTYAEMQHDIEFLREQADLREVLDNKFFRKKYRQRLRREAAKELTKLEAEEKRIRDLQNMNKAAKPWLYELIDFAIHKLVRYFPNAKCEIWGCDLIVDVKERNAENAPEITYCLHWFHSECIRDIVSKPPFNPLWPVKDWGQKIGNRKNKTDKVSVKQREKSFGQFQARKADADEIDAMFNF